MSHGWMSSAQPVIVMAAAAAGWGDTGPIIGFLRSGDTREGRHTQRTISLYQTESMQAGLFTPFTVQCVFLYLELGQEGFHFLHFQFVPHPNSSSAMWGSQFGMAWLTLVPMWIKMDSVSLYSYSPAIKWIFPVEKLLQGAALFIVWGVRKAHKMIGWAVLSHKTLKSASSFAH